MDKAIRYFYHITHIDNVKSILKEGLFSKNKLKKKRIKHTSILRAHNALKYVRTDNKNCDNFIKHSNKRYIIKLAGLPLNNYVPLYFNPECAILNIDRRIEKDFVVICINKDVLKGFDENDIDENVLDDLNRGMQYNTYFSTGVPTNAGAHFFDHKRDLNPNIDWTELLEPYNYNNCFEGLSSLMPEVLVRDKIQSNKIEKIICKNSDLSDLLKDIIGNNSSIQVEENRRIYFMSGYSMETDHIFNIVNTDPVW